MKSGRLFTIQLPAAGEGASDGGGTKRGSGRGRGRVRRRGRAVAAQIKAFCDATTIHGLRYIAEGQRPWYERAVWLAGVVLSFCACATLVLQTWQRWRAFPIIVSMDDRMRPVWEIPFSAVTLCPAQRINASRFPYGDALTRALRNSSQEEELQTLLQLSTICDVRIPFDFNFDTDGIMDTIEHYSPDVDETIVSVEFRRNPLPPGVAFQPILTESGICFAFNMLENSQFFNRGTVHASRDYLGAAGAGRGEWRKVTPAAQWTQTGGYSQGAARDAYPLRATAAGADSGLQFSVRTALCEADAACADALHGHTVTLHAPTVAPWPRDRSFRAPLEGAARARVGPLQMATDAALQQAYASRARLCLFPSERPLAHFALYTQSNCELECLANFTRRLCGCAPAHMTRLIHETVCSTSYELYNCVLRAKEKFQEVHFGPEEETEGRDVAEGDYGGGEGNGAGGGWEEPRGERERCGCLPTCSYLAYESSVSTSDSKGSLSVSSFDRKKCNNATYREETTVLSTITIYYKETYFIPNRRVERFGMIDFLANCGGLFGLCLGVSALSVLEVIHWMLIRPWRKVQKEKQ